MTNKDISDVQTRIQMAFMEMPEMRLTRSQVQRLLNVPADACERALATLVQSGFLTESLDGALARSTLTSAATIHGARSRARGPSGPIERSPINSSLRGGSDF